MKKVIIIGAGPCGLFAATRLLANSNFRVELYEKKPSAGNKLLVAGKSGLNLTHSCSESEFVENYFEHSEVFHEWFSHFNNNDLVEWVNKLGIETFIGSSGRVFPKDFKAAAFLKIWIDSLKKNENFSFHPKSQFTDFDNKTVTINSTGHSFDHLIFALGGKSWKATGSAGDWVDSFKSKEIKVNEFFPLNCGFNVRWNNIFDDGTEILPIKYINVKYGAHSMRGDIMLTRTGVEGTPFYFLSHYIQRSKERIPIFIDLKPDLKEIDILSRLTGKKSISSKLKSILSDSSIKLLKELTSKDVFLNTKLLASAIKNLELNLEDANDIDEAISTGGGICMNEVDKHLELKKIPNVYLGGEMLDWDAPTGGYLLQACFTQGAVIAKTIIDK